jgi:aminopeptidase N
LYVDRLEALNAALGKQADKGAQKVILAALKDKYYPLQIKAIKGLEMTNDDIRNAALPVLTSLAQTDVNNLVRAAAIEMLGKLKAPGNMTLFKQALNNPSYAIEGAALSAIVALDPTAALPLTKGLEKNVGGNLTITLIALYADNGTDEQWPFVSQNYKTLPAQAKFTLLRKYSAFTARVKNPVYATQGIEQLKEMGIQFQASGVVPVVSQMLNTIKAARTQMGDTASAQAVDNALKAIGGN